MLITQTYIVEVEEQSALVHEPRSSSRRGSKRGGISTTTSLATQIVPRIGSFPRSIALHATCIWLNTEPSRVSGPLLYSALSVPLLVFHVAVWHCPGVGEGLEQGWEESCAEKEPQTSNAFLQEAVNDLSCSSLSQSPGRVTLNTSLKEYLNPISCNVGTRIAPVPLQKTLNVRQSVFVVESKCQAVLHLGRI